MVFLAFSGYSQFDVSLDYSLIFLNQRYFWSSHQVHWALSTTQSCNKSSWTQNDLCLTELFSTYSGSCWALLCQTKQFTTW